MFKISLFESLNRSEDRDCAVNGAWVSSMNDFVNAVNALTNNHVYLLMSQDFFSFFLKNLHLTNMIIYFLRWFYIISAYVE